MNKKFIGVYKCGNYFYKAYEKEDGNIYVECLNDLTDWSTMTKFQFDLSYDKVEG